MRYQSKLENGNWKFDAYSVGSHMQYAFYEMLFQLYVSTHCNIRELINIYILPLEI